MLPAGGLLLALLVGVLLATEHGPAVSEGRTVAVADFGARGNGVADDGPALRRALEAAAKAKGPVSLAFEPKTYRLGPYEDHWFELVLRGASDVTLDGHGATLLVHPQNRVLLLEGCRGVTVRGFDIDYDPLPYTQGDVLAVDSNSGWFALRLHAGYPEPPAQEWVEANGGAGDWRHGVFTDGPRGRFTHCWVPVARVERDPTARRTFRIHTAPESAGELRRVQPGQCFGMRVLYHTRQFKERLFRQGAEAHNRGVFLYGGPLANIRLAHCRDCTLADLRQFMAPDMGIHVFACEGTRILGCQVLRKPGTDRLMAGMSDGLHCKTNRSGPVVERCYFEALGDDSINISIHPEIVLEQRGTRQVLTQYSDIGWFDTPVRPGDRLLAFDPVEGVVLGAASVVAAEFVENQTRVLTLDRELPGLREAGVSGFDQATQLYLIPHAGFEVRGCTFRTQLKTAMLVRGSGVVANNDVRDCAYGVTSYNCPRFREGPFPHDLAITGNRFENVWLGAITLLAMAPRLRAPLGENILVEDNAILQRDGHGIEITNLTGLRLVNNCIVMAAETPPEYFAVRLARCGRVQINGLEVEDMRPTIPAAVVLDHTPAAAISCADLRVRLAEGVLPVGPP